MKNRLLLAVLCLGVALTGCSPYTCPTYDSFYGQTQRRYKPARPVGQRGIARRGAHTKVKSSKAPKEKKVKMAEQE